jgi:para-nitrobenzyl esterase
MRHLSLIPRSVALSLLVIAGCGGDGSSSTSNGDGGAGGTGSASDAASTTSSTSTASSSTGATPEPAPVDTDKGPVQGKVSGETRAFLGIPYAAPPVGALRWKPPQPAAPWTAPLEAKVKGPACPQFDNMGKLVPGTSEDCLTLNVWTPATPPAELAPVLLWVHGGSFVTGSGGDALYDGQALSEATGSVVITINYRLGPLGFLGHSALAAEDADHPSAGMYGFEDQRAALAWAKTNAKAFGGDPENVTLFGESAGGISTCLHLLSPKSEGLFQRAIIESGPCHTTTGQTKQQGEAQADKFATALGCSDPATVLSCMRGKTSDEVLSALPNNGNVVTGTGANWFPLVDGWNISDQPAKLFEAGSFTKVPTLLGTNKNEGTIFFALGGGVKDETAYKALLTALFPAHADDVLARYPLASFSSPTAAAAEVFGDSSFVCPTRRAARALAKAGVDSYLYHFTHALATPLGPELGVFHASEIPFIFGNPLLGIISLNDEEKVLSQSMVGYWSAMARSGDPNAKGASAWPKYDATGDQNIVLDFTFSAQTGLKKDICDFWDQIAP